MNKMEKLTQKLVASLKPTGAEYSVSDTELKNFVLRVGPTGRKTFAIRYRNHGISKRYALGTHGELTVEQARRMAQEAFAEIRKGYDPEQKRRAALQAESIKELADDYMEKWAKPRKRSWKDDERMLNKEILPVWKNRKAIDITRKDINQLLDRIVDRGAKARANNVHALIHKLFNYALNRDIVPFNPCAGIPKPSKQVRRDRILSDEEIKLHWEGFGQMPLGSGSALKFQLATAQRKGEVIAMRWDEIEGDIWTIPASRAKNGIAHRVVLSKQAQLILADIRNAMGDSEWVFPSPTKDEHVTAPSIDRALRRHLNGLGFRSGDSEWFTPHDLRRTAASKMTEQGINRLVVSKVLNHAEQGVTAIYDRHSYDPEKRHALETWGRRLESIITGEAQAAKVIPLFARAK